MEIVFSTYELAAPGFFASLSVMATSKRLAERRSVEFSATPISTNICTMEVCHE